MSNGRLVTGTVRGRQGDRYVVVRPDGQQLTITLEGIDLPQIGVDLIGVMEGPEKDLRMRLVPNVTRMLLEGRSRIIPSGRPDLTARMLARLLQGTGPASIRAGIGGMIERTPTFDDPDVAWALAILGPESVRAGIALNVIDPIALAASPWDDSKLKEEILPADTAGEAEALADLHRLLNDGMTPACSRTVTKIGRGTEIPSVNFIMPYSPFATGQSWSAEVARAWRSEVVTMSVSGSDARRLSTFREVALAFAPKYLGRLRGTEFDNHREQAFADAAAAIALMNFGGSSISVLRFQRLREAALARWDGTGKCPPATSAALAAVLSFGSLTEMDTAEEILQTAASIAKAHTPSSTAKLEALKRASSAESVFVDLDRINASGREHLQEFYRADLAESVNRLHAEPKALARMSRFGIYSIPEGFEEIFDATVGVYEPLPGEGIVFEDTLPLSI